MQNKAYRVLLRIALTAVFSALCFVVTSFLPISYGNGGYFNFGDVITILVSIFIGPVEGIMVGILGGGCSDIFLSYINYLPFTIIAKCLLALVSGVGYLYFKHKSIKYLFPILGGILMATSYIYPNYAIYENSWYIFSCFDLVQGLMSAIFAMIINELLLKAKADTLLK